MTRCKLDNLLQTNYETIRPWNSNWDGFFTLKYHEVTDKQGLKIIDGDFSLLLENLITHEEIYIINCKFTNTMLYN